MTSEGASSLPPTGAAGSGGGAGADVLVSGNVDLSGLVKQVKQLKDNLDAMEASSNRAQVNLQRMASTSLSEIVVQTGQIAANLERIGRAQTGALDTLGKTGRGSLAATSAAGTEAALATANVSGRVTPGLSSFTPEQRTSYDAYAAALSGGFLPEGMGPSEAKSSLYRRVQLGGERFLTAPTEKGSVWDRWREYLRAGGASDLGEDVTMYGSMGFLSPSTWGPGAITALEKGWQGAGIAAGAAKDAFGSITSNSNRHSTFGAFGYGLTVVPGFMAAQGIMSAAGSALSAGSDAQSAAYDSAFTQSLPTSSPIIAAELKSMTQLADKTGFAPADLMTSFTENYRLAGNQRGPALDLTRAGAITSRITGNDPATTQAELAPLYKSFDDKSVVKLPDILAQAKRSFDVNPADLELAMARAAPIVTEIGVGTKGMDMEYLAAMSATLMQDADLNPATTQSAIRMFGADLRAKGKAASLKKMGFGDISNMSIAQAMQELADVDQGTKSVGGKTGHNEAMTVLETLSGPRTGMYAGDLLKAIDKFSSAVEKFANVAPGTGAAYVAGQMTKTMAGEMDRLSANWKSMFSDQNFGPTQFGTQLSGAIADMFGGAKSLSDERTVQDLLSGNKLLHKADTFDLNPLTLSGPGNNALLMTDPGKGLQYVQAANASMIKLAEQLIEDPKTSAKDRASLLSLYNTAKNDLGDPATYVATGVKGATAAAQAASTHHTSDLSWVPQEYRSTIISQAARAGISPSLLAEQLYQENRDWATNKTSKAGAQGLAQMMPGTAQRFHVDPLKPLDSIRGMASYDQENLDKFHGNIPLMLAAYNAGPGAVISADGDMGGLPKETQDYVNQIMGRVSATLAKKNLTAGQAFVQYLGDSMITQTHGRQRDGSYEAGIDYVPKDPNIKLAQEGKYLAQYSTKYASLFQMDNGQYEEYTHINPKVFKDGQMVAAGTMIGSMYQGVGPYSSAAQAPYDAAGHRRQNTYQSNGPHVEFGVFNDPNNAFMYKGGQDPMSVLQSWANNPTLASSGISIVPKAGTGATTDGSGVTQSATANYQNQSLTLLQGIMDNTQAATDAMTRMASINLPSDYTIPTYSAWAAHNGAGRAANGSIPAKSKNVAVHAGLGTSAAGAHAVTGR